MINGSYSDYANIESGVPQGSVLGPLLFLVYINDLEKNIKSNVKFFADDTMLYSVVKDPKITAVDLNHDLNVINQWANQWKMAFNPDPTKQAKEVLFSCKKVSPVHPDLLFNGTVVTKVNEHKHLGLTLQSNLSFDRHLNEKMMKAKKIIGILKHLSKFLPLKTLNQMYKSLVRSHLDYCDIIYHMPQVVHQPPLGVSLHDLMESVEKIQYQAGLAITGCWQGSSRIRLYEELGWESLSDRRRNNRIFQIYKIISKKTLSYLKDKLPPCHHHFLVHVYREIRCKTNRYSYSFFPDAISSWNTFISHFEYFPTYSCLKKYMIGCHRPEGKPIFDIHDPVGLRYLFQLRLGLSPLRSHKNSYGFADTPSNICLCKLGTEDTRHFLFSCPFYATKRAAMIGSVDEILQKNNLNYPTNFPVNELNLYLYGLPTISPADNSSILMATIKFIKNTNRFSP